MPQPCLDQIVLSTTQGMNYGCEQDLPIVVEQFLNHTDEALLLFLQVPDYLCDGSNSFIPIMVTLDGKWQWGQTMPGAPGLIRQNKNILWLTSQWQVEGSFPILYQSNNGLSWHQVLLPENREVDCCFEYIEQICFYNNMMGLKFHGASENTIKYWQIFIDSVDRASFKPEKKQLPKWNKMNLKNESGWKKCDSKSLTRGRWSRNEISETSEIIFTHKQKNQTTQVRIPKFISVKF